MAEPKLPRWGRDPAAALVLFVVATVWGLVIVPHLAPGATYELVANDHFRTWLFTLVVQFLIWIVAVVHVWTSAPAPFAGRVVRAREVLLAFVFALLAVLPATLTHLWFGPYFKEQQHLNAAPAFPVNVMLGVLALAALGWGIVRIHQTAIVLQTTDKQAIALYLACSTHLKTYLALAGAIIAASLVGTRAHSASIMALDGVELMSKAHIFQWALFASALLGTTYTAAKLALLECGARMRDELCPWPEELNEPSFDWKALHERRSAMSEMLKLDQSPITDIESVISILSPLVASGAASLLM